MAYASSDLDVREAEELCNAFELADNIVFRNYINRIEELDIVEPDKEFLAKEIGSEIRLFKIEKIIYDKDENNLQKLTNLYHMAYSQNLNIFLMINSDGKEVELYMGLCQEENRSKQQLGIEALYNGFVGNFPGSLDTLDNVILEARVSKSLLEECFADNKKAISVVSGVASIRGEKIEDNENFVQGIEKLIDSMRGNAFSTVIIANPVPKNGLIEIRNELETLYSTLKPFEKTVMSFSESHAQGISNSISKGLSDSYGSSKSKSLSLGTTLSTSKTKGHSIGGHVSVGGMLSTALSVGSTLALGPVGRSISRLLAQGINGSLGLNASEQKSKTETEGTSKSNTYTDTTTRQHTKTTTNTDTTSETDTTGNTLQIEYLSKNIKQLLDRIDLQLERLNKCESFGVFAVASYFLAKNSGYSSMAASIYKSLMSGDNTSVETSSISSWQDDKKVAMLKEYLKRMYHPVFKLMSGNNENNVTAVSVVSGNELAIQLGLPKKSVAGVVVTECASFGRNLYMLSGNEDTKSIDIGNIYHMCSDENTRVNLKIKDLSMHTFITGATGSGKSNAIYTLLKKLDEEDIKFMVVEPAKGEYKHIFGNRIDVEVFGTNPKKNQLLRINPFSFPDDIHVLEHIDKLIEIFNVCWPMYAAMPAVLKEAVEQAYVAAGWNLDESENINNERLYPTFDDVLKKLAEVINTSEFSDEVKSNYAGALLTRVKSLTNGINGMIFSGKELESENLFDKNVIIDISRVGSMDTKSLIMGILVMKLQEYRVAVGGMNQPLKHVTVLEEAHNLLKGNASSTGAGEGADLVGKSVEMLSNIIAEIRTYGEGFVIADQAPGLLDASVIRNTNTKIILRLPDYSDRQLVGKAANLSDVQINELAKLPVGVAAVYHNDWIEPVLCHISKYDSKGEFKDTMDKGDVSSKSRILKYLVDRNAGRENSDTSLEEVENLISTARIQSDLKLKILSSIKSSKKIDDTLMSRCICELFDEDKAFVAASQATDITEWNEILVRNLDQTLVEIEQEYQNIVIRTILSARAKHDLYFEDMNLKWQNYMARKGIL